MVVGLRASNWSVGLYASQWSRGCKTKEKSLVLPKPSTMLSITKLLNIILRHPSQYENVWIFPVIGTHDDCCGDQIWPLSTPVCSRRHSCRSPQYNVKAIEAEQETDIVGMYREHQATGSSKAKKSCVI